MKYCARAIVSRLRAARRGGTIALAQYFIGISDGLFNLGSALAFAQSLPFGTYAAMKGHCLRWDSVHKNRSTGVVEEPG